MSSDMDVDTLLTRQMELHTTTRRPPKNAEQLLQLRETLLEYKRFFGKLQSLTTELESDRVTVFQCLMHISVGGAVKFDKQAQNDGMPMHQAKVLARATAIELEPFIYERVPLQELMVYVGLSKDLRATLRVKVEDENDLKTVQKSVEDSVEYLDFIYSHAKGDGEKMFAFYMVEDGPSLVQMIEESENNGTATSRQSSPSLSVSQGNVPTSMLVQEWNPKAPLPPMEKFREALEKHIEVVKDRKVHASERVVAAQDVLDWLTQMEDEHFKEMFLQIIETLQEPYSLLCCDKRSTLCRVACDTIILCSERQSTLCCVSTVTEEAERYATTLSIWTTSLLKGIYVTISTISSATDAAIRKLIISNHGNRSIVSCILDALAKGKQTELRRKCLGYLALAVSAAEAHVTGGGKEFTPLLIPVAENYVELGDSPSRKMARALCAVLRGLASCDVTISNPKVEKLVEREMEHLQPHFAFPRSLETKLFDSGDFVSSINSTSSGTGSLVIPSSLLLPIHENTYDRGSAPLKSGVSSQATQEVPDENLTRLSEGQRNPIKNFRESSKPEMSEAGFHDPQLDCVVEKKRVPPVLHVLPSKGGAGSARSLSWRRRMETNLTHTPVRDSEGEKDDGSSPPSIDRISKAAKLSGRRKKMGGSPTAVVENREELFS